MKTERQIIAELQTRELRQATNSSDINRPLCRDERDRNKGWVTALRWVLDEPNRDGGTPDDGYDAGR